jgi:preprotein translocase subunit YajC
MAQQPSWMPVAIYFGIFLAVFWVFIILPRKKQEKKHKEMLTNLKRGDKVVTIGGLRGEVARIKDDTITIKVNESTEIDFVKKAIAYLIEDK